MKISTKGRYGTRFMLDLALNSSDKPVTIKEAAARQNISVKYLEQIIPSLNKAGLIRSTRGSQGGYTLACEPAKITIGMILNILEGSLAPVDCACDDNAGCSRVDVCVTHDVWKKVYTAITNVVDNITLLDLVNDYNSKKIN